MTTSAPFPTVASLAAHVGGELRSAAPSAKWRDVRITGLDTVQDAAPGDLTFIGDEHHAKAWTTCKATAAVVSRKLAVGLEPGAERALILVDDADVAIIALLELFAPPVELPPVGTHPGAAIESGAALGANARIGPFVWIARGASIGANVTMFAGTRIYPDVTIGDGCVLHANVTVRERCILGRGVTLHGGVQIGTDGFGYRAHPEGRGLLKVPHLGNVVIEEGVEIGANTCVDRGKFGATVIGAGTKIDNLVQIGHNCRIGRFCVISGVAGIAGSTTVGDGAMIGGGAGISDHLRLGRGVQVAARSGVMHDIPDGEVWAGYPAKERRRAWKEIGKQQKLPEYLRNLKHILGPEKAKILEQGPTRQELGPLVAGERNPESLREASTVEHDGV